LSFHFNDLAGLIYLFFSLIIFNWCHSLPIGFVD